MSADQRPRLECQACGRLILILTEAQAQQVAERPHNFIVYCRQTACQEAQQADARREGLLA